MRTVTLILLVLLVAPFVEAQNTRDFVVKPGTNRTETLDPNDLIRAHNDLSEFVVTVGLDDGRTSVVEGDPIRFAVRSERAGYVTLLTQNSEGKVLFLYPNAFSRSTRIRANETIYFPGETDNFTIAVSPPFGMEYVKAIVTPEPLVDPSRAEGAWARSMTLEVQGPAEQDGGGTLGSYDPSQWASAEVRINSSAKRQSSVRLTAGLPVPLTPAPRFGDDPQDRWDALFGEMLRPSGRSLGPALPPEASTQEPEADDILVIYRPRTGTRSFGESVGRGHLFSNLRVVDPAPAGRDVSGTRSLSQYGQTLDEQVLGLNEDPDVLVAVPNYSVSLFGVPLDPSVPDSRASATSSSHPAPPYAEPRYWDLQWALYNGFYRSPAERVDMGWLDALRRYRPAGTPVVVAVLDTGALLDHPALQPFLWTNTGEIPGNGRDDDGNGYVDDVHGWDTVDDDGDPTDTNRGYSHGTFVATQIPYDPTADDLFGIAPSVRIMPVRVLDEFGVGQTSGIMEGIDYAVRNGAQVVNISLGVHSETPLPLLESLYRMAFEAAEEKGAIVVMAAGNDAADSRSSYTFPARVDGGNAVSVGALSIDGSRAPFSNHGPQVDLAAPGERILGFSNPTTVPINLNGTSWSAAYVAAAAAMIIAQNPGITPAEVKDRLLDRVTPLPGLDVSSGGALHIGRSLATSN